MSSRMYYIQEILCNSIYMKFWKMKTNLWWQKTISGHLGMGGEGEKEGWIAKDLSKLLGWWYVHYWMWWWFHSWQHVSKLIKVFILNMPFIVHQLQLYKAVKSWGGAECTNENNRTESFKLRLCWEIQAL